LRFASYDYYGIDPVRLVLLAVFASGLAVGAVYLASESVLGGETPVVCLILGAIVMYLVLSAPRRMAESATLQQAKEATILAAAGSASLEATHSRTRSVLALDSGDETIARLLVASKRNLLLGYSVADSLGGAVDGTASQSARNVLEAMANAEASTIEEGGEETQAISQASQLSEESKLPLFMAAAFFAPILLTLFAVLTHQTGPGSFGVLVLLQMVILDIAYYVSSAERDKLR